MSDDKVVRLVPEEVGEDYFVEPDQVLVEALGEYVNIVVIGERADRMIDVCASSNMGEANLLIDLAKKSLLDSL